MTTTDRDHAAEDLIRSEMEHAARSREAAHQLAKEAEAAAVRSDWGRAFVRWRAQDILRQALRTEVNAARSRTGRPPQYVAGLHDLNLVKRIEGRIGREAANLAEDKLQHWRQEQARYERGDRSEPPPWPTVIEGGDA